MTHSTRPIIRRLFSPSSLIHRYSRTSAHTVLTESLFRERSTGRGKRTSTLCTTILYHLVPLRCRSHSLTLPDDEDHNMLKSEYPARYHLYTHPVHSLHPSFAATSQTLQFGLKNFRIIQNFPNLLALLSNLDDFFQKILHRMKVNSTKLSPFPLQFGVILKPLGFHFAPPLRFRPLERPRSLRAGGRTRNERRGAKGMCRDPPRAGKHSLQWNVRGGAHFLTLRQVSIYVLPVGYNFGSRS